MTLGRPSLFRGYAERLRRAPAPEAAPAPPLRLEFGRGRSAEPFLADGWEDGAEHGRWTRGCDARLTLRFPESWIPGDLELDARMVVGLWPDDPRREVELWVNGRRQARWHFEGDAPAAALKRVRLARELLRDRRLALLVHVPRPYAPSAQFGHCRVPRAFGVHLGWIRLEPASS